MPESLSPRLRIVQINDVYELDAFPHLATLIQEHKPCLVVCAGDFLAPSLLSSLDHGRGMMDVLESVGCTHVCIGNHETDIPMTALAERIQESKSITWINSNMPDLDEKLGITDRKTVPYSIVSAGDKKVALLGLLTEDPSLYRLTSFGGATIRPVNAVTEELIEELQGKVDLIVPLTHQSMEPTDRAFCERFGGGHFPLVLGGHDHEMFDEVINGCRVLKTGMDAENAAVIDIEWSGAVVNVDAKILATRDFVADAATHDKVQAHQAILKELEQARLFNISDWITPEHPTFTTKDNRLGPSSGTQALSSMIRMGMRCQCALLNAGCVRAAEEYRTDQHFTWSDLKAEMPFPTLIAVCRIPGQVLENTINHSRRLAGEGVASGGYIHPSRSVVMDGERIVSIMGSPFDPEEKYLTALPIGFLQGIDNHEPLLEWAKSDPVASSINEEAAIPSKLVLVEVFSALLWLQLGSFEELANGDGLITRDDVRQRMMEIGGNSAVADLMVDNVFAVADINNSGNISAVEQMLVQFVATDMMDHVVTSEEMMVLRQVAKRVLGHEDIDNIVTELHESLDTNKTGSIQREEIARVLGAVRNRDILS